MNKYLFLLFCIILASCKSSTAPNVPQTQVSAVIMPLAIGNAWAYSDTLFNSDRTVSASIDSFTITPNPIISNGDTIFQTSERTYYVNRYNALWFSYPDAYPVMQLFAKYPGSPGDIFGHDTMIIRNTTPYDTAIATLLIDSVSLFTGVPAGRYLCYKYLADYFRRSNHQLYFRQTAYYGPGVGLIKRESFTVGSNSTILVRSETYQLLKATIH